MQTKNLGPISNFLSLRVNRIDCDTIAIDQNMYIDFILEYFNMSDCKSVSVPLSANVITGLDEPDTPTDARENRKAIGMLLFVANGTKPDLSFPVSFLSHLF